MRNTSKALALAIALTLAPSLFAAPRGSDPGFDFSPIRKLVRVVKHFFAAVLDQPQGPPPAPISTP